MKSKYCLPIIKKTQSEVLSDVKTNDANYGFFEVWLDYVDDLNPEFLLNLLNEYEGRLVFVFRRQNLERSRLSLEKQTDLAKILDGKNCLVDLDVYDQSKLIQSIKDYNLKTIISYHNYKETEQEDRLYEIVNDIRKFSPEIIKVSTFCNSKKDSLVLLKLMLELKSHDEKHIILGMGSEGLITRIYGVYWGNELTFIPENKDEASAPGQLSRQEFEKLLEEGLYGRK